MHKNAPYRKTQKGRKIWHWTIKLKFAQRTSKTEQNYNQKTIWGENPINFWTEYEYNLGRLNNFVLCKWSGSFSELMKSKKFCNSFRWHHRSHVHSIIWQVANISNTIQSSIWIFNMFIWLIIALNIYHIIWFQNNVIGHWLLFDVVKYNTRSSYVYLA